MESPNLFIQQLINNPNALIQINGLSKTILAYTTQDFQFNASAQWSGRNPSSYLNIANNLERAGKEGFNRLLGNKFGELSTGMTLDVAGSMLNYQGTNLFGFGLNMYFIATNPDDDVRNKIGYLAEGLFPTFGKGAGGLMRIHAPNKFKMGKINDVSGAMSIRIGRWFRTTKLFVIDSMDFTISKETISSGRPLYASGSVLFKSVRVLSIGEVKGMFGI